jgi:hypothetical protein
LAKAVVEACKKAADEQGDKATFTAIAHGNGYDSSLIISLSSITNAAGVNVDCQGSCSITDGSIRPSTRDA